MKKAIAIALVLVLALSLLAACGGKDKGGAASGDSGNNITPPVSNGGADSDEMDKALSEISEYLKSLGLEEDEYGFTQYGVWNTALLPDCVPPEPSGGVLEIDRTEYKDKHHEDMMAELTGSFSVGNVEFPDKNHEYHMVMFYCTKAQVEEFAAGMLANGFDVFGGPYVDVNNRSIYEWLGNGYYAYMSANPGWDESEDRVSCTFEITPLTGIVRPKAFNGTPLPDFGVVTYYYESGGYGWNESGGEWEDVSDFWDIYKDKGKLPEQWTMDYDYYMVKTEQAKTYVQSLVSKGWRVEYEDESHSDYDDSDQYYVSLEKGGVIMRVQFSSGGTDYMSSMEVDFGSNSDVFG